MKVPVTPASTVDPCLDPVSQAPGLSPASVTNDQFFSCSSTDQLPAKTRQRREDLEQGFPRVLFGEAVSGQEKRLGGLASKHHTHRRVSAPNRRWKYNSKRLRTL